MYSPFSFSFSLCFVKYRITMKIAQFYDSFCLVNTLSRVLRSQSRKSARASERAKEVSEWVTFQWSLRSGVFSTIFHFYSLNNNFLMATNSEAHYSIVCKFHASGSQGKKKSIKCLALRIWCKAKLQANEQQQQRNDSSHTNTHIRIAIYDANEHLRRRCALLLLLNLFSVIIYLVRWRMGVEAKNVPT